MGRYVEKTIVQVHAAHKHGCIGGWGGDDDLLGATFDVETGLLLCGEDARRLNNVVGARLAPWDLFWCFPNRGFASMLNRDPKTEKL